MKFHTYKGQVLRDALVTIKLDGIRAHKAPEGAVSREGKPLHNLTLYCEVAEVFCGSWEATLSAVRTHDAQPVAAEHIYSLAPQIDHRLIVGEFPTLFPHEVADLFAIYRKKGHEGLVIHSEGRMFKVKDKETYDVEVTGVQAGKGKHAGRMGALLTSMGKVGTGFSNEDRAAEWAPGMVIEVDCTELTPGGKFRHARFVRRRIDKEKP